MFSHLGALTGLFVATWPALLLTGATAQADPTGFCKVRETVKVRCIREPSKSGVLVDVTPRIDMVRFHVKVWHSICGRHGIPGPEFDATLVRGPAGNNTYRFDQGLPKVFPPKLVPTEINCVEFFIEGCRNNGGPVGNCNEMIDVVGRQAPYER
ncbi:hypothetical protein [Sphingomonas sp. KR3-1]|uniref:hypothetical protein n=1 Tax=Sphingomonas sp. KR3-1 TaxID=3156611 RepID=UPI0032B31349